MLLVSHEKGSQACPEPHAKGNVVEEVEHNARKKHRDLGVETRRLNDGEAEPGANVKHKDEKVHPRVVGGDFPPAAERGKRRVLAPDPVEKHEVTSDEQKEKVDVNDAQDPNHVGNLPLALAGRARVPKLGARLKPERKLARNLLAVVASPHQVPHKACCLVDSIEQQRYEKHRVDALGVKGACALHIQHPDCQKRVDCA